MELDYYIYQNGIKLHFERGNNTVATPLDTSLEEYLLEILKEDEQLFYCIVGEFGTGKSSLML